MDRGKREGPGWCVVLRGCARSPVLGLLLLSVSCLSSCTRCFLSSVRAQYGVVDGVFIHRSIVLHPATHDGSRVSPLRCKLLWLLLRRWDILRTEIRSIRGKLGGARQYGVEAEHNGGSQIPIPRVRFNVLPRDWVCTPYVVGAPCVIACRCRKSMYILILSPE